MTLDFGLLETRISPYATYALRLPTSIIHDIYENTRFQIVSLTLNSVYNPKTLSCKLIKNADTRERKRTQRVQCCVAEARASHTHIRRFKEGAFRDTSGCIFCTISRLTRSLLRSLIPVSR